MRSSNYSSHSYKSYLSLIEKNLTLITCDSRAVSVKVRSISTTSADTFFQCNELVLISLATLNGNYDNNFPIGNALKLKST